MIEALQSMIVQAMCFLRLVLTLPQGALSIGKKRQEAPAV